jgi:ankyrin repeat protein
MPISCFLGFHKWEGCKCGICGKTRGAEHNRKSNVGLLDAAKAGDTARVRELLLGGADLGKKDEKGRNALHLAALNGYIDIIETLLAAGMDINERDQFGGNALHLAATLGKPDTTKVLIAAGADMNATDDDGFTPLHRACLLDRIEFIQALAEGGANLEAPIAKSAKAIPELAKLAGMSALNFATVLGKTVSAKALEKLLSQRK